MSRAHRAFDVSEMRRHGVAPGRPVGLRREGSPELERKRGVISVVIDESAPKVGPRLSGHEEGPQIRDIQRKKRT